LSLPRFSDLLARRLDLDESLCSFLSFAFSFLFFPLSDLAFSFFPFFFLLAELSLLLRAFFFFLAELSLLLRAFFFFLIAELSLLLSAFFFLDSFGLLRSFFGDGEAEGGRLEAP